jgi:hypothetical protein
MEVSKPMSEAAALGSVDPDLLDMLSGHGFVKMSANTAAMLDVGYAAIVLADSSTVWFGERHGFTASSTSRDPRLWDRVFAADGTLVIEDAAADPEFAESGLVVGDVPVRFFAARVVRSSDGEAIGAFCIADAEPQVLPEFRLRMIVDLARWIETELLKYQDLDKVAGVQQALLPKTVPPLPGYEVAGACLPARAAGGDFYDWYAIDGGLGFTLADVMGKGVAAALIAATVRATVRSAARNGNVRVAVERAAETLAQDLSETASFVTLFHARLEAATGKISFVDAGHGLTVLMAADGSHQRLGGTDLPLGIEVSGARRARHRVTLEEGGTLVTFSDGVLDLYDGSLASVDAVADIVRTSSSAQGVVDEITRLAKLVKAPDDITVLAIRRSGGAG